MNRRTFLASAAGFGLGATTPGFLARAARAAGAPGQNGHQETILVVVQLTGGNDGLNTIVPVQDPLYYRARPTLAVKKPVALTVTSEQAFHPKMRALADQFEAGRACIVQGVGYPNPSQSHFRSMDIWQAARTADELPDGWVGRALKQKPLPAFHLTGGIPGDNPLALHGSPAVVPAIESLADFRAHVAAKTAADKEAQVEVTRRAARPGADDELLDFVRRTASDTYDATDKLNRVGADYTSKVPYPETGLGRRLKLAAQLIEAGTGGRVFYVGLDGFDTHSGQGGGTGAHANLLGELSEAIGAFLGDLAARGQADRVCVMTFSEFGRRVRENGSRGTDHGAAAPMMLFGGGLKPGFIGGAPDLAAADADGNLPMQIDFRRVYADVLARWLGIKPQPILGAEFAPLGVFA